VVADSIRSKHVVNVPERLVGHHGASRYLRSDNGPEFVSQTVLKWLSQANIDTAAIDPGKPWQNGTNESFHDRFRDECLNMERFRSPLMPQSPSRRGDATTTRSSPAQV